MKIRIRKDYIYYTVLVLIVLVFIVFLIAPISRSISKIGAKISGLRKETTITLLNSQDNKAASIFEYHKAGLISRDDMVSYIVGRIHAKFKEKGVEILDLNPVSIGDRTSVDLSFKISNENFLGFLVSLSEMGLPFSVESVNISQLEDNRILVKMRIGF